MTPVDEDATLTNDTANRRSATFAGSCQLKTGYLKAMRAMLKYVVDDGLVSANVVNQPVAAHKATSTSVDGPYPQIEAACAT